MLERRAKLRVTSTLEGQASFASLCVHVPCLILNHNAKGACVLFPAGTVVPGAFGLALGKQTDTAPVKVVWRRRMTLGVAFMTPRTAPDVIAG